MKRFFYKNNRLGKMFLTSCMFSAMVVSSQNTSQLLQKAFQQFEDDSQLKFAISSLYVVDAKTGKVVFDKNSRVGLAPASTQKIITSVTAFEVLGRSYQYTTTFKLVKDRKTGKTGLAVFGAGDPTLGSWRYASTRDSFILKSAYEKVKGQQLSFIVIMDGENGQFGTGALPEGYMWQDMGNYYGTGHYSLNWKENQYDVSFASGFTGLPTRLVRITMDTTGYEFKNEVVAGPAGSGDNSFVYSSPYTKQLYIRGTVPPNQNAFTISGATPDPALQLATSLKNYFESQWAKTQPAKKIAAWVARDKNSMQQLEFTTPSDNLYAYTSPTLDSIIYWFNKKSINLYGEALLKTMAIKANTYSTADSGAVFLQRFWKSKGLDEDELNIADGSGLSPINRVTTHIQVEILKYAQGKDWYPYFFNALPEYNGMKMKSGTIRDVKGFCGYHKAKDGNEYIFSFLVNNYNGPSSMLVNKMFKVLDVLK